MFTSQRLLIAGVGLLISAAAAFFIIQQIDWDLFTQALVTANYWYLIPCFVLVLLGLGTRSIRWHVLLSGNLPYLRAFHVSNIAYLLNGVLPMRLGEAIRIYLASRASPKVTIPQAASSVVVERLIDLFTVVLLVLSALVLEDNVPESIRTASIVAAIISVIGFSILIALAAQRQNIVALVQRLLPQLPVLRRFTAMPVWVDEFLAGIAPLTNLRSLSLTVFWTIISWGLSVWAGYVLMFAFFPEGSVAGAMLFIAAASFAIALPAVPGNIGTYEASILLALTAVGYNESSTAVAFAVMVHAVNVLAYALLGIIGFVQEGISFGQLSRELQEMQQHNDR